VAGLLGGKSRYRNWITPRGALDPPPRVLWDKAQATGIVPIGPKLDFLAGSGR